MARCLLGTMGPLVRSTTMKLFSWISARADCIVSQAIVRSIPMGLSTIIVLTDCLRAAIDWHGITMVRVIDNFRSYLILTLLIITFWWWQHTAVWRWDHFQLLHVVSRKLASLSWYSQVCYKRIHVSGRWWIVNRPWKHEETDEWPIWEYHTMMNCMFDSLLWYKSNHSVSTMSNWLSNGIFRENSLARHLRALESEPSRTDIWRYLMRIYDGFELRKSRENFIPFSPVYFWKKMEIWPKGHVIDLIE